MGLVYGLLHSPLVDETSWGDVGPALERAGHVFSDCGTLWWATIILSGLTTNIMAGSEAAVSA